MCLHFCASHFGHHTHFTQRYQIYLALILYHLANLLLRSSHSCPVLQTTEVGWGRIIAVGMIITQSQQESKQNRNTTGTRTHIARLGISDIVHAGEDLKRFGAQCLNHPQLKMD